MIAPRPLAGVSVLVLEDNYYIAEESQRILEDAGAHVLGLCRDLEETLQALEDNHPHCAVVNINLGQGPTFEPARALRAAGVTILLVTGYDVAIIPADLKDTPCLHKPVDARRLVTAVVSVCRR